MKRRLGKRLRARWDVLIETEGKSLGLSDRLLTSGERYANPGSCSVPLTLASSYGRAGARPSRVGRAPARPSRALLAGFGAGLSAAAASVEISPTCERGVVEL